MHRFHDPGPCPVDDAPHTTCVAPAAVSKTGLGSATQAITVPVQRPGWLRAPAAPAAPAQQTVQTFTTSTYKRSEHGRRRTFGKGSRGAGQ
jgi:hypothetical protein